MIDNDTYQHYEHEISELNKEVYRLQQREKVLEQQLAEKDKEIDELQDKLHSYYEEIMNKGTCGLCEYVRNDYKINYAVEKLEKVKSFSISDTDNGWCVTHKHWLDIVEFINQLITEIKEGK